MKKDTFEDDGRTISDMSFTRTTPNLFGFSALSKRKGNSRNQSSEIEPQVKMSKGESRRFMLSAILAGLSVSLVFIGGAFLFILFCVYVWF
jgi:hypothetical protein